VEVGSNSAIKRKRSVQGEARLKARGVRKNDVKNTQEKFGEFSDGRVAASFGT
jgi:hypothetical protein